MLLGPLLLLSETFLALDDLLCLVFPASVVLSPFPDLMILVLRCLLSCFLAAFGEVFIAKYSRLSISIWVRSCLLEEQ